MADTSFSNSEYPTDPRTTGVVLNYSLERGDLIADVVFPKVLTAPKFRWVNMLKTVNSAGAETFRSSVDALRAENFNVGCYSQPKEIDPATFSYELGEVVESAVAVNLKDCGYTTCDGPDINIVDMRFKQATDSILIERELKAIDLAFNVAQYGATTDINDVNGNVLNAQTDFSISLDNDAHDVKTFMSDIQDSSGSTISGYLDTAVMDRKTFNKLRKHPSFYKATLGNPQDLGQAELAVELGVERIVITNAKYNGAAPGVAFALQKFVEGKILLMNSMERMSSDTASVAFGFSAYTQDLSARQYFDQKMGATGGNRGVVWHDITPVVTFRKSAVLIQDLY